MTSTSWTAVDAYLTDLLVPEDGALTAALRESEAAGLPAIQVAANEGKLLHLLVRIAGARRVLEVGTLGGYGAIWMARALPPGGRLVTLELEAKNAAVARANLARAGLADVAEVRVGPAAASMKALADEGAAPSDFVFLDADKEGYAEYLSLALRLARPGTVIVADNVVRSGGVVDPASADPRVQGVRAFLDAVSRTPGLDATAVQTVGPKGHDGFALLVVGEAAVRA